MPLFTRTGATADGDFPAKRKNIFDRIWRWSLWLPLASLVRAPFGMLVFFKLREAEAREKAPEVEPPWHGLPEADLTEEQRLAALERMHRD